MIAFRRMTERDIPAGLALCRAAGWNQFERDWRLFLTLAPETTIVAEFDGSVAGTAALLDFHAGFAWISMVLVDPVYRGRGIGTALFERALELARDIPCVRLDASPEGRGIYRKYGFVDDYEITRLEGVSAAAVSITGRPPDFAHICELDRQAFGADRSAILRASFDHDAVMQNNGFALARAGFLATHIGPIIAPHAEAARALLATLCTRHAGQKIFVDVPSQASPLEGFVAKRRLIRMSRGLNPSPGKPEKQFAILGPEFG